MAFAAKFIFCVLIGIVLVVTVCSILNYLFSDDAPDPIPSASDFEKMFYKTRPAEYWVEVEQELEKCNAALKREYDKLDIYAGPEYVKQMSELKPYLDLLENRAFDLDCKLIYKPKELTSDND